MSPIAYREYAISYWFHWKLLYENFSYLLGHLKHIQYFHIVIEKSQVESARSVPIKINSVLSYKQE
jgi:hypothetical protein